MQKKLIMAIIRDIEDKVSFAAELESGYEARVFEVEKLVHMSESLTSALKAFN